MRGLLRWFTFKLANVFEKGKISNVNLQNVFWLTEFENSAGFEENTVLVLPYCSPEFHYHYFGVSVFTGVFKSSNDLVGYMRNSFDIFSSITESPFPVDNCFIYLSCGNVIVPQ